MLLMRAVVALWLLALSLSAAPRAQDGQAPPLQRPLEPAGEIVLASDGARPDGALPVAFVRSPDSTGPEGRGRYLIAVNSGYGTQDAAKAKAAQMLQVIDLAARPAPVVVQTIRFPSPRSVNVGLVFGPGRGGTWPVYASGGVQNGIWRFTFAPGAAAPLTPAEPGAAPAIDLRPISPQPARRSYNSNHEPLYPTGLAIGTDGTFYVANNLGDTLGIVADPEGARSLASVDLPRRRRAGVFTYPYDVAVVPSRDGDRVFVSCWAEGIVAVVDPRGRQVIERIAVGSHPSTLLLNEGRTRLFVASSNADTVSVIDTAAMREVERIRVGLQPDEPLLGNSPQGLALDAAGSTLFASNAQSQSIAVVRLGRAAIAAPGRTTSRRVDRDEDEPEKAGSDRGERADEDDARSQVVGYIPTARYPSAVAVVGGELFVGNGKGEAAPRPNPPSAAFPPTPVLRGPYSVALMAGSIRRVSVPTGAELAQMTSTVFRVNGLVGPRVDRLFSGPSPIKHVIYVIKENRTYDQVFGDVPAAGDGTPADGDPALAIFGRGAAARRPGGPAQDISPNHRKLALRFGLFDRFFVNAEASPDGHNWSTAAMSSDYVDKAFRWQYSGRGRTYDYEGFNRLPNYEPASSLAPLLTLPATAEDIANFMRQYVPYLHGGRDAAEPDSLYLWDAAARAGLTYRNFGEFIGTISAADVNAVNARTTKPYPDLSETAATVPTKRALEGHHSRQFRAFDMWTPDAITVESYRAAREQPGTVDPVIRLAHRDPRFRGTTRLGAFLDEFDGYVADLRAGRGDALPSLSILRLPTDHTAGMRPGHPSPQFMMADNDYAVGRLVEAVSQSPYWANTAMVFLEDDAQDGPDHVDMHRSPILVVSAYNEPGALVHEMHNTVSAIRTIELLLGIPPMNVLDAAAIPMNIFRDEPDLSPYTAELPDVALDNLVTPKPQNAQARRWVERSLAQDIENPDMADPAVLNGAIWYSVRGSEPMPAAMSMAAVEAMRSAGGGDEDEAEEAPITRARLALARLLRR
jgi:YVTN family beta-propeller protein